MKRFWKIFGLLSLIAIFCVYMAFLFYLPRAVDLEVFKPEIEKIAKEQAHLDVDIQNLKLKTTPALGVGIKTGKITVKLPDGSVLLSAESAGGHVALPSLLLLTVKVPEIDIQSPRINLDIANGEQFKVVRLVENILNEQKNDIGKVATAPEPLPFDPSIIRIKVPNIKIHDYKAVINDEKSGHSLTLAGDELALGYFNGKVAKLKTEAKILSDDRTNIVANLDINTFIPPAAPKDEEDDEVQRVEIPFVNPVLMYRDYDLKSDVNAKLKIRQSGDLVKLNGFLDVEKTTMNLSGYQLPECYAKFRFSGTNVETDTNLYVTKNQHFQALGKLNYGHNPSVDMALKSQKIYFNDVIVLAKAFLDTLHIKNEMGDLKGHGYILANANIKTNLKKIKSNGSIIVREGGVANKKTGLVISDVNANFLFDNNMLNIKDTKALINGAALKIAGKIEEDSVTGVNISSEAIPIPGLFAAFAPADLKRNYNLYSGTVALNASVTGKIKKAVSSAKIVLNNLALKERTNLLAVTNGNLVAEFSADSKSTLGRITNRDFKLVLPQQKSVLSVPSLSVNLDNINIILNPVTINLNDSSSIIASGQVAQYTTSPLISFFADGKLATADLKQLAGKEAAPFLASNGAIPLKAQIKGNDKKQTMALQIMADGSNYFTPVEIAPLSGKQSILQARADFKGDRLRVFDTGLYVKSTPGAFSNDFDANMAHTREIASISGTITALDTKEPFINLFRIMIPHPFNAKICAFKDSGMRVDGGLFLFGKAASPRMRGHFRVSDLRISDLLLAMQEAYLDFRGKELGVSVSNLLLNGSDLNLRANIDLNPSKIVQVYDLNVNSSLIDVEKMMKVADAAAKLAPPASGAASSAPAEIPVLVRSGAINMRRILANPIVLTNTTGDIALRNNVFFLNNLRTSTFGGNITGSITTNLLNGALGVKVNGAGLDVEDALLKLANMKDTLTGTASFTTDIALRGATQVEQMKSLKGKVTFSIKNGQLGPFGKIENLILAENIRESEFFKTTIGQVINSITSIETSHYDVLSGVLNFKDGIAAIDTITSQGKVLSIHIAGNMNLLTNEADMKLRGRLASQVSDMLGPLAYINPVNLIKNTPGMNVLAAKAFFLFCESVTEEEMKAIPELYEYSDANATKFQVVLRGDTTKPLTLVKSFKWLAEQSQIDNATAFASTLPEPVEETQKDGMKTVSDRQNVEKPAKERKFLFFKRKSKDETPQETPAAGK